MITLAVVNARVWTGNPRQPWASGIAIEGDKIAVVASSAEVAKLVAVSTQVIDAKGGVVRVSLANDSTTRIERGAQASFFVLNEGVSVPGTESATVLIAVQAGQVVRDERTE